MFLIPVEVQCHAGYKGDETPRFFVWARERIEIEEVVDRWYEGGVDPTRPVADYFRVRVRDGGERLLKHDPAAGEWYLVESF
jgi:hypothetical protein